MNSDIKSYKLFTTRTCPKCPEVKAYMQKHSDLKGEFIDASTKEGLDQARKFSISSVPTVLFFDESENLVVKCHTVTEIQKCI